MEDKDNGYHSNDNELDAEEDVIDSEESHIFDDLQYEDTDLAEPDYEAVRMERFKRNKDIMKTFSPYVAKTMDEYNNFNGNESVEDKAAIVIQKRVRGFLAQRQYLKLLMEKFEKDEKLRREKTMEQMEEASYLIENHQLEVQFEDYNVVRKNKLKRLICYVITIQRAWRKFSKRKVENKKTENQSDSPDCEGSFDPRHHCQNDAFSIVQDILINLIESVG